EAFVGSLKFQINCFDKVVCIEPDMNHPLEPIWINDIPYGSRHHRNSCSETFGSIGGTYEAGGFVVKATFRIRSFTRMDPSKELTMLFSSGLDRFEGRCGTVTQISVSRLEKAR